MKVNGKMHGKKSRLILSGGDEVVFGVSGKQAYVSFRYDSLAIIYLFVSSCSFLEFFFCMFLCSPLQKYMLITYSLYLYYKLLCFFILKFLPLISNGFLSMDLDLSAAQ